MEWNRKRAGCGWFPTPDLAATAHRVLLAAVLLASSIHAQLVNPGFESNGGSLSEWTTFNNVIPNVIASTTSPRSGAACAKTFGGYNGNPNWSGFFQNVPASGGQFWQAQAYFRHNSGDSLVGTSNRVLIKIEFYRVPNGSYGSADMLLETQVEALSASSPLDSWNIGAHSATAPAGTVETRLVFVFEQRSNAGGAAFVDDVTFVPTDPPPDPTWELIWNDEFDGASIDGTKWRVEDLHLNKNNELQYYAPDEVYVSGGDLTLRSRRRSYWGYDNAGSWRHFDYTSGLVETRDRFATTFGRIEVRAKLPSTRGLWPAHWMLPDSRQWPPEIDIMELLGHEPTRVYMTHHWGTWPQVQSDGGSYSGPDFSADFHTFAIEWSPTRIDWKVDGLLRFSSTSNIPREPFYIILNTAVGGDWPGNPDGTTVFPQYHRIDYVRVYAPADPGTPVANLVDSTAGTAVADGVIAPGEYATSLQGINAGLQDRIGRTSTVFVDSAADGRLNIAFQSTTAWSAAAAYGVVTYVDSQAGGYASTYGLADIAARARRLASGKGLSTSQRSDLYFAAGFRADYAVVFEPNYVTVFRLDAVSHEAINGAALGAALDMLGGTEVRYRLDDGSQGGRIRECELRLAQIGVAPGGSFRFVCTMLNGDTAFRANEFVGVASGNTWDAVNPGASPTALKPGDYAMFTSVAATPCGAACGIPGASGDLDGDCDVDLDDLTRLLGHFGEASGAIHEQGDADWDGDVDLVDLTALLAVFGNTCP
ncbi:MAG: glycoside hydrolase family 16 protein [Planctomycetes bacterium]|nr:glycoside hydrolase family 16 protein [Planctomycetota bacterium]